MLAVSPLLLVVDGSIFAISGRFEAELVVSAVLTNLFVFVGVNALGLRWLARPVGRLESEAVLSDSLAHAVADLPWRSALWVFLLGLIYGGFVFWGMVAYEPKASPAAYAPFVSGLIFGYALFPAFICFFVVNDFAMTLRAEMYRRHGLLFPPGPRKLGRRLVVAFLVLALVPLVQVLIDLAATAAAGPGASVFVSGAYELILIDVVFCVVGITVALIFVTRWIARPVDLLLAAVGRVREGDLATNTPIVSDDEVGVLSAEFNRMIDGLRERELLRDKFGLYMDRRVAEKILASGLELSGEARVATVLVSDIEGYSGIAEARGPAEVVALLNEYFDDVVAIIARHDGIVNKYVGDSVVALFNVPVGDPEHATKAVQAALEMVALTQTKRYGGGVALRTRIGVNSGEVLAGSIGARRRPEYTVIGEAVNVAARLEALNKERGTYLLVGESTRRLAGSAFAFVEAGEIVPRGMSQPLCIFEVRPKSPAGEVAGERSDGHN